MQSTNDMNYKSKDKEGYVTGHTQATAESNANIHTANSPKLT